MDNRRWRYWVACLAICCSLLACASLPTVAPDGAARSERASGKVAAPGARSLLERSRAKGALDLARQAALEHAATGVPLIAGNKEERLFDGPQTSN